LADASWVVRSAAAEGMVKIGADAVPALVEALAAAADRRSRALVVRTIDRIGDACAVEPLIDLLSGADEELRGPVIRSLARLGDARAVAPIAAHLEHEPEAAEALADIGDPGAVRPLIEALDRADVPVRTGIVEALGRLGDERAAPALGRALTEEEDDDVWRAVVAALGRLRGERVAADLIAQWHELSAKGTKGLCPVARALGEIGDPGALEVLVPALEHRDFHVREAAIAALSEIGDAGAFDGLVAVLDREPRLAAMAAVALANIGDERAIPHLERRIGDGLPKGADVARHALASLQAAHGREAPQVSVVAFRTGVRPPDNPLPYVDKIIDAHAPGAELDQWRVVGVRHEVSVDDARSLYRQLVIQAQVPHLGREIGSFTHAALDGGFATGLLFTTAEASPGLALGITAVDLDLLRRYWRDRAESWWGERETSTAICDGCNDEIPRPTGYLHGSYLLCRRCVSGRLESDALEKLRANPSYFGDGELERARDHAVPG
ncbi:MAG: HEAT repeat domain-containing protein, partial [Thermoanaerobaculia bacterium]|nr:HEAT repeat domain-containing protein [Thermoanaerobaculia bacterium]